MESEQAYKGLLILTKKYKFNELHSHIKNIGPLKIKLSKLKFDHHLCKIIVGQQISTKAADAIWVRVEKILKGKLPKKPTKNLQKKLKDAGLSARKVDYMIGIIYNDEIRGIIYAHKIAFPKKKIEEKFYKQFSPYNSYLSLFMWRLLEDENLSI